MHYFSFIHSFLYTDEIHLKNGDVYILLHLADKYDVPLLLRSVVQFLIRTLNVDNACKAFDVGYQRNLHDLTDAALDLISINASKCLRSETFFELDIKEVAQISSAEGLSCTEEELFEALDLLAEKLCQANGEETTDENKRKVMDQAFYNVRFPLMEYDFLISKVTNRSILSDKEHIAILQSKSHSTELQDTICGFRAIPRKPKNAITVILAIKGQRKLSKIAVEPDFCSLSFEVSHSSLLYGILIYGPCTKTSFCAEVQVSSTKSKNGNGIIYHENKIINSTNGVVTCKMFFQQPVYLVNGSRYEMHMKIYTCSSSPLLFYQPEEEAFLDNSVSMAQEKSAPTIEIGGFSFAGPACSASQSIFGAPPKQAPTTEEDTSLNNSVSMIQEASATTTETRGFSFGVPANPTPHSIFVAPAKQVRATALVCHTESDVKLVSMSTAERNDGVISRTFRHKTLHAFTSINALCSKSQIAGLLLF